MYSRVVNFTGAKDIDAGITFLQEKALPAMRDMKGYRGLSASVDRAAGSLGVLSLWETEEDREGSDSLLAATRQEGADVIGGEMTVEKYEVLVSEVGAEPPAPGSALWSCGSAWIRERSTRTPSTSRASWLPGSQPPKGFGDSAT